MSPSYNHIKLCILKFYSTFEDDMESTTIHTWQVDLIHWLW